MFDKRIIIGGLPRSGSTLLRFILDSSDDILSGPETSFFTQPLHKLQARSEKVATRLARKLELDVEDVQASIMQAEDSFTAFDGIMEAFARSVGVEKSAWAEKSPDNCIHYGRLLIENPDTYFISTIRHGIDVATSVIKDHPKKGNDYWCSVQLYADCMAYVMEFDHPNHIIVRYEDLVREPESVLDSLSTFLDMRFDRSVLERFNQESKSRDFSKVNQPKLKEKLQDTWVGRYRDPAHKGRVEEFMQHERAVHWLQKSGYEVE
ncbi:MAG: sulfotransferase [Gammaproteobacteria bacterium]|nr:sulfotransferase [Gammaproteobacteria bacterium]